MQKAVKNLVRASVLALAISLVLTACSDRQNLPDRPQQADPFFGDVIPPITIELNLPFSAYVRDAPWEDWRYVAPMRGSDPHLPREKNPGCGMIIPTHLHVPAFRERHFLLSSLSADNADAYAREVNRFQIRRLRIYSEYVPDTQDVFTQFVRGADEILTLDFYRTTVPDMTALGKHHQLTGLAPSDQAAEAMGVEWIVDHFPELATLHLTVPDGQEDLSSLTRLDDLSSLTIRKHPGDLGFLPHLQGLQFLELVDHRGGVFPLVRSDQLVSLRTVRLSSCESMGDADVASLARLPNLQRLHLFGGTSITTLGPLANAPSLREVRIEAFARAPYLENMYDLPDLSDLEGKAGFDRLEISGMCLPDLRGLTRLTQLTELVVDDHNPGGPTHTLLSLAGLEGLARLEALELNACSSVKDFSPIGRLRRLKKLRISMATLDDLSFLDALTELETLELWSVNVGDWEAVRRALLRLQKVDIRTIRGDVPEDIRRATESGYGR